MTETVPVALVEAGQVGCGGLVTETATVIFLLAQGVQVEVGVNFEGFVHFWS